MDGTLTAVGPASIVALLMDKPQHTAAGPTESHPSGRGEGTGPPAPYREPPILRYFRLLWEHRRLILGGSLLPALLVALILYLWPGKHTATFFYERPLAESEYSVLLRRFHSQENLDKIIGRLQEQGLTRCVRQWNHAQTRQSFDKLIRFEVAPMYPKRLQTTDPCTSEKISAFKARLLSVEVLGDSPEEVAAVSAVVTGNLEDILPLYDIRSHLKESLAKLRGDAAKIEDDRFTLSMDLQKERAKLEKLKALAGARVDAGSRVEGVPPPNRGLEGDAAPGSIVLQFNVDKGRDFPPSLYPGRTAPPKIGDRQDTAASGAEKYNFYEFLPLSYQVRAAESKIVDLQETLSSSAQKHDFDLQAIDLDSRLLAKIEESLLTYYTAQQYLGFLSEQLRACQDPLLGDHLRSYIRKTENLVLVSTRAGEKAVVHPVSKDILTNSILAFFLFLMVAGFVAVLLEHRQAQHGLPMAHVGSGMAD